jgi:hypothetical protein
MSVSNAEVVAIISKNHKLSLSNPKIAISKESKIGKNRSKLMIFLSKRFLIGRFRPSRSNVQHAHRRD